MVLLIIILACFAGGLLACASWLAISEGEYMGAIVVSVMAGIFIWITLSVAEAYHADIPGKCDKAGGVYVDTTCINKNAVITIRR
jgi:hypothetical protein